MGAGSLESVPAERRETVRATLAAAFGSSAVDALQPIGGGASGALTYRVEVAGRSYLLRIETRRSPLRNPHQYDCMRIAAEAGIAPALRYVDADAGVAVMDLVPQRPLAEYPGGGGASLNLAVSRLAFSERLRSRRSGHSRTSWSGSSVSCAARASLRRLTRSARRGVRARARRVSLGRVDARVKSQ